MSCLKFLSENYYDDAQATLTSGTEHAQFPLVNLKNDSPSVKFRGTGASIVIEIDLLQTRDIDTIAVLGSPTEDLQFISASAKTSVTTDFSSSPTYTLDISQTEKMGISSFTEVNHRYVELTLTTTLYAELGKIFIGKAIEIEQNGFSIDSFKYERDDRSKTSQNRYGQVFIDVLNKVKSLGGDIEFANKSEQEQLDDMFLRHGQSQPLWLIVDPDSEAMNEGQFKLMVYGYLTNYPSWSASGGQHYNTQIEVRQAI